MRESLRPQFHITTVSSELVQIGRRKDMNDIALSSEKYMDHILLL